MLSLSQIQAIVARATPLPNITEEDSLFANGIAPALKEFRERIGCGGDFSAEEDAFMTQHAEEMARAIDADSTR